MVKIYIDDIAVEVKEGITVLKAAGQAGIPIPHFCYHPAFPPEGSCRMCLVEIEELPKLELACSTVVREGMRIQTRSEKVVEARRGVLEFLLAEHPLDCPICDKAGECKLQDYYEEYGLYESRFRESKEKREKKIKLGKNLILDRERCILCTRCTRFLNEVTQTAEAGVFHRGIRSEISTYEAELVNNNYSGNLAEICPVGAITDLDFRFKTRTWFLESKESVCPLCSRGCNIFIESHPGFARVERTQRVYRVRSRENAEVNKFWVCDVGRYSYSYLDEKRCRKIAYMRNGHVVGLTWDKVFILLAEKIKSLRVVGRTSRMAVVLTTGLTNEELFLADKIFKKILGVEKIFISDPVPGSGDNFLLTAERTPNKRGAQELGFDFTPLDLDACSEKIDVLLLFGNHCASRFPSAEIRAAFDKIGTKALLTPHAGSLDTLVDFVLPTTVIAEKGGSLTNVDGKIQKFSPALEPLGESLPEWKFLSTLAKELGLDMTSFQKMTSPEAIRREMGKEIPFFR